MALKLQELQKIVKSVVKEEKNAEVLREEVTRVLGPTVLTTRGLERMAESANDRLDVLDAMNRAYDQIKPSVLLKFIDSNSADVRKLVARLLPENFLKPLMKDPSPEVRGTVARRLSHGLVKEMVRRFPNDDNLRSIEKTKRLMEKGLPSPKIEEEYFDMYGEEPLGNAYDDVEHPGLTDAWYDTLALKIFNMYGRNIESQWEEDTVHRYVDSISSMHVDVDREKLLKKVYELLDSRDEKVVKESTLKNLAARLRLEDEEVMPVIPETVDPVEEMLSSRLSNHEYVSRFEKTFFVEHKATKTPDYLNEICEGTGIVFHPAQAKIPSQSLRPIDERALDTYVKAWNFKESKSLYRLTWSPDQERIDLVNFHLELK
jgi:hypothetical protein